MKLNVVFLDTTNFYGYNYSAANSKTEFIARGLVKCGDICNIINSVNGYNALEKREIKHVEGVGNVFTYPRKGSRLFCWIKNIPLLKQDIKELYRLDCYNWVVLLSPDIHIYWLYMRIARKYSYKIAVISHEWLPTVNTTHPIKRPFSLFYANTFGYGVDCILPISEYIINKIKRFGKPYIKLPALAEFKEDVLKKDTKRVPQFVYCVYAAYLRAIIPIIDAYSKYVESAPNPHKLILVLGGTDAQVKPVSDYILNKCLSGNIVVKRKLPYSELNRLYETSRALIIPLDPKSEQDAARFSQKIAEYVSTGTPILSCDVGEVSFYFKDKENAIFSDYSIEGFASSFKWIANNVEEIEHIGKNGFKVGQKNFDYKICGKRLHDFLNIL